MSDKETGLYDKYTVTRNDNSEKHKDCRYFVLDMDHDKYALVTLILYAQLCREEHPELAADLDAWAKDKVTQDLNKGSSKSEATSFFNKHMGMPTPIVNKEEETNGNN